MGHKNPHYLTGKLLLAMPSIGDPRFDHAVIYICAHDENGAMGLAVNEPAPELEFGAIIAQLGLVSDIQVEAARKPMTVMNGGPVDPGRGFLLHTMEFRREETIRVDERFGVTGTLDALREIADGGGPKDCLFILGYAGWSAGQLESELKQNAWLVCDPSPEILFTPDIEKKWHKAVSTLGFDPALLASDFGRA